MRRTTLLCTLAIALLITSWSNQALSAEGGTAVLRVETIPSTNAGSVRFGGTPAGQLHLSTDGTATLRTELAAGRHVSTLESIAQSLRSQGYSLTAIACDDRSSQRRSHGDMDTDSATFEIEDGETVTCTFQLGIRTACTCPLEGRWKFVNHVGSMACTGAMSMTVPLKADSGQGTLEIRDDCDTILAAGMSEGEADILMHVTPECSYFGTVDEASDGIPMSIEFRWNVENTKRITGDLKSDVVRPGMTCHMSRTYELDYAQ